MLNTPAMDALQAWVQAVPGRAMALAKAVGVTRSAVSQWLSRKRVPADRVLAVAEATKLKPYEIRPDLYPQPKRKS